VAVDVDRAGQDRAAGAREKPRLQIVIGEEDNGSMTEAIATRRPKAASADTDVRDHDLPLLAREQAPAVWLDWDELMAAGVQPALPLGAERRWQGRR
jgi:hypothetical protein